MSEQVNEEGRRVALVTYIGPAGGEESRRRWQLSDHGSPAEGAVGPGWFGGLTLDDLRALHLDIGLELYRVDIGQRENNGERVELPEWLARRAARDS